MIRFTGLTVIATLITALAYSDGIGFNVGPFSLQFGASGGYQPSDASYVVIQRTQIDDPICFAISHLAQLSITVESRENISAKEKKVITKRLLVEPYAFGVTREGKPVLRGNIVEEKMLREVSVKFGEAQFDAPTTTEKEKGYFSGLFSSDKTKNINIDKVMEIQVVQNSHFNAPKDYKGVKDEDVRVICQLPITN